eukprot:TRINITY_DN1751_c0_g1_i10.p3 TRINITY_DN1751_c0_g1~~TRINITY_DN1751_c0_g1_i10.p3  ORF type:complete len:328 (+),score=76.44 TRINITY_DN1751_c0_g1_i10:1420-2403(+)
MRRLGVEQQSFARVCGVVAHTEGTDAGPHIHMVAVRGYPHFYAGNLVHAMVNASFELPTHEEIPASCRADSSESKGAFVLMALAEEGWDETVVRGGDTAYICVTKTGSTTMANSLKKAGFKPKMRSLGKFERRIQTATVVREPLRRFCSGYAAAIKKTAMLQFKDKAGALAEVLAYNAEHYPKVVNRHMLPQIDHFRGERRTPHGLSFVGEFEQDEWNNIGRAVAPRLPLLGRVKRANVREGKLYHDECDAFLEEVEAVFESGLDLDGEQQRMYKQLCAYLQSDYECLGFPVPPLLKRCGYEHADWARPYNKKLAYTLPGWMGLRDG